jgi:hypothetical protein
VGTAGSHEREKKQQSSYEDEYAYSSMYVRERKSKIEPGTF